MPQISVLMPVYNGARFLRPAIESILTQTFADFEFVIVDDGSTDESATIISSYADDRILMLTLSERQGISAALNHGIARCCAPYIARMDADDISLPQRLQVQFDYLQAHPQVGYVATAHQNIRADGHLLPPPTLLPKTALSMRWVLLWAPDTAHSAVMMRRSLFAAHQVTYRSRFDGAEDYDLWTQIVPLQQPAFIPQVHFYVRIDLKSFTHEYAALRVNAHHRIMHRELARFMIDEPSVDTTEAIVKSVVTDARGTPFFNRKTYQTAVNLICDVYARFCESYLVTRADEPHIQFWLNKLLGRLLRSATLHRQYGLARWHLLRVPATVRVAQVRKFVKFHVRANAPW